MMTALIGIGGILALFAALVLIYLLRWVLAIGGIAGMAVGIVASVGTLIQGQDPTWIPTLMLASLGAALVGLVAMGDF